MDLRDIERVVTETELGTRLGAEGHRVVLSGKKEVLAKVICFS